MASKAALIFSIWIGIRPIPAIFDGIKIGLVFYISTNSVIYAL